MASLGDHEDTWSSIYHYMCEHLIQSGITPNDPMYILDVLSPMECQIRWNALRSNGSSSGSMLGGLGQGVASKRRISSVHHQHDSSLKSINASNVNANANNVNVNVGSRNNSSNKNANKNYVTWTEEEESQLIRMVEEALHSETNLEYTKIVSIGSDKVRTISWTNIAKAMNRSLEEINHMWTKMRLAKFKHGAYSAEEDRLIITRVREWYSQPEEIRPKSGLWVSLEKELNREDKRISERWRSILSKRVTFTIQESVSSHSLLSEPSSSKVKRPRKDHLNSTNCNSSNNHHRSTSNSNGNIGFDSSGQHTLSHSSHHPLHTQQHVLSIAGTTIGSSSFPSHPSIAIDNYGMLIENSHKGKDRNHKNNKNHHHNNSIEMIPLVDETGYEFEVMDKPESIRWNEEMVSLLALCLRPLMFVTISLWFHRIDY